VAESEIGVLESQCLNRRIAGAETLETEVQAWEAERNALGIKTNWTFTREKAAEVFKLKN
jgi:hypothetical protein